MPNNRAALRRARDEAPALAKWKVTRDGLLIRIAGDWEQSVSLDRDKHGRGWYVNTCLTCVAMHDGWVAWSELITTDESQLWSRDQLARLAPAIVAQARPSPSQALTTVRVRPCVTERHPSAFAAPTPLGDEADPYALVCIAVLALRDNDAQSAGKALARALRSPRDGGLSATWEVTDWARDSAARTSQSMEEANDFLDATRETYIDDLGPLE